MLNDTILDRFGVYTGDVFMLDVFEGLSSLFSLEKLCLLLCFERDGTEGARDSGSIGMTI